MLKNPGKSGWNQRDPEKHVTELEKPQLLLIIPHRTKQILKIPVDPYELIPTSRV